MEKKRRPICHHDGGLHSAEETRFCTQQQTCFKDCGKLGKMSWKQLDSKEKKGAKETFLLISKLAAMVSFSTVVEKLLKSIIC